MGRIRGLFDFSASFEVQYGEPLDGRAVVQFLSDLTSQESWAAPDGNVYTYVGMRVSVVNDGANNGVYWLKASDYTDLDNWERLGSGSGSGGRTYPFVNTAVVVIPDVNSFPIVETYVEVEVASNIEGEQLLYGEYLYGEALSSQMGETAYETVVGVKYRYSPLTNELRVIMPEAHSGVVVIKS